MQINHKSIYYTSKKEIDDLQVKETIKDTFAIHPAYGHRRLALELGMNHKKVRRVMKKYGLKPPRLWYKKRCATSSVAKEEVKYHNLPEHIEVSRLQVGDVWSCDLTYIKFQGKFVYLSIILRILCRKRLSGLIYHGIIIVILL